MNKYPLIIEHHPLESQVRSSRAELTCLALSVTSNTRATSAMYKTFTYRPLSRTVNQQLKSSITSLLVEHMPIYIDEQERLPSEAKKQL